MLRTVIAATVVIILSCLVAGCSPVRLLNALIPDDTYIRSADLPYGADARQKLDVYQPQPTVQPPRGGYPVIVFFYGGSWRHGSRTDYKFVGEALASQGFIAVLPDYRLYPEVSYPEFLKDSARAVAWAKREAARYGGNPAQLYVMGHSAGGYNAAMVALDPRWLRGEGMTLADLAGWIGLAGAYDFLPSNDPNIQPVFHHPDYPPGAEPIAYATRGTPRAFLGAALVDPVVSPERSTRQMAAKLRAAGVPLTLKFYEGVNHMTLAGALARPLRGWAPVLEDVSAFVRGES
jgi:acetyl esterase/lipase